MYVSILTSPTQPQIPRERREANYKYVLKSQVCRLFPGHGTKQACEVEWGPTVAIYSHPKSLTDLQELEEETQRPAQQLLRTQSLGCAQILLPNSH
jgi:hypothetical protein